MPNLEKYSKADLIWIINRLCKHHFNSGYSLKHVLNELTYQKKLQRLDTADQYAELAYNKRMEYIDLLKPYAGKMARDVPRDIMDRAIQALKDAEKADSMYCKLMQITD